MAVPDKKRQYAEQSARTAANIAAMPEWMQRNLTPPVIHYDDITRDIRSACCASGRCTRRGGSDANPTA
jgi:hypothetical protein